MADTSLVEKLEALARECYFDMNQGDNSTFDQIEKKYMRILVTSYGFTMTSAKKFVNESEINSGLSAKDLVLESLPMIVISNAKINADQIVDEFFVTGNLSQAVKNIGENLDALESQELVFMHNYSKNKSETVKIEEKITENGTVTKDVFEIQKTKWVYVFPSFLLLMSFPYFSVPEGKAIGIIFLFISLYFFARSYLYRGYITDTCVKKQTGVFFKKEEEMVFTKVETVLLSNILIWQNASITGSGGTPIEFKYITNGKELKNIISNKKQN